MSDMFQAIQGGRSKDADPCPHCAPHSWHGEPCRSGACLCQTSFEDKYANEEDDAA